MYTLSLPSGPVSTSFIQSPSVLMGVHSLHPSLLSNFPKFHTVTVCSNWCTLSSSPPSGPIFPSFTQPSSVVMDVHSLPPLPPVQFSQVSHSHSVVMGAHPLPSLRSSVHKFHTVTVCSNGCTLPLSGPVSPSFTQSPAVIMSCSLRLGTARLVSFVCLCGFGDDKLGLTRNYCPFPYACVR